MTQMADHWPGSGERQRRDRYKIAISADSPHSGKWESRGRLADGLSSCQCRAAEIRAEEACGHWVGVWRQRWTFDGHWDDESMDDFH
jgi:hypothetical protein